MFLGDSYTWGSSARPITESFVDLVKRAGYCTFNFGIPGTDPCQYAALAEKWLPLLHPGVPIRARDMHQAERLERLKILSE